MSFFWSNRSNSFAGIWKRSARYWITSYVGNCLFGPPGWRGGRMCERPGVSTRMARADRWSPEGYHGTEQQIAEAIGYDTGYEGDQKGWSREKMTRVAFARVSRVLGRTIRPDWSTSRGIEPTRPAAVARTGGLRGGARQWK